jgi:cyanophycinase
LLIIGGGEQGTEIQNAAIELGGKPARWVFIPTAGTDAEVAKAEPPAFIRRSGATSMVLHTPDRKVADSEAFVAPLRTATAVFFEGGRQWRLVDAYGNTRTERELRGVLDRNGLIAGTSAGATIQGSYLVLGAPESNTILMSPGHERGFGYLSNAAIDQHVGERGRENDLSVVVASHPGLLGVGIDENTAVIVQHNAMTVIGRCSVRITDGADHGGVLCTQTGRALRSRELAGPLAPENCWPRPSVGLGLRFFNRHTKQLAAIPNASAPSGATPGPAHA